MQINKKLTLQDFVTRLQVLCHDGYSQEELFIMFPGCELKNVSEAQFFFKSEAVVSGVIPIRFN